MKIQLLKYVTVLFALSLFTVSCNNDDDGNSTAPNGRTVRYEISGNYTGKLLVVTSTNTGMLQQFNNVSIPWTKELSYNNTVLAAGAGMQTENGTLGVPGQTVVVKIYLNGVLRDTKTAIADANGTINIAMSFYTF